MEGKFYAAPWGGLLKATTLFSCLLLIGIAAGIEPLMARTGAPLGVRVACMAPLLTLVACVPFVVSGYTLRDREMVIHRMGWSHIVSLAELVSAERDPDAFKGAIKTMGNGGLFSITGWFASRRLGSFRAYATDPARSVVLRYSDRTVVVTPESPGAFVEDLNARIFS